MTEVNDVLKKMEKNGELDAIRNKWIIADTQSEESSSKDKIEDKVDLAKS